MTIDEVENYFGSLYQACKTLDLKVQNITSWRKRGYIPFKQQLLLAQYTAGFLSPDEIDPDLARKQAKPKKKPKGKNITLIMNQEPIEWFKFSGGEIQVKLPIKKGETFPVRLTWKPNSEVDIMLLLLTVDALKQHGFEDISLTVLYMPYARQDRVCAEGEAYSYQVMQQLIANLKLKKITFYDLHSPLTVSFKETKEVIENTTCSIFVAHDFFKKISSKKLILCAPDKGAEQRVELITQHYPEYPAIYCKKGRNPTTGQINSIWCPGFKKGADILVIDDICDGGVTFIELAKVLKEKGADKIYLYVTHGIFSKGLDELMKYYEHIYCHHVLHDNMFDSDEKLTILRKFTHAL